MEFNTLTVITLIGIGALLRVLAAVGTVELTYRNGRAALAATTTYYTPSHKTTAYDGRVAHVQSAAAVLSAYRKSLATEVLTATCASKNNRGTLQRRTAPSHLLPDTGKKKQ